MKNAKIKDFLQAFGPGAHIESSALWRREANGCAFAAYSVCVMVVDGTGRVVARAVDDNADGDPLFVSYDEEDLWWHGADGLRGHGEGGRAADACCRRLEEADWGDTPVSLFEADDGSLLPWEEDFSDELVGGIVSLSKGRRY